MEQEIQAMALSPDILKVFNADSPLDVTNRILYFIAVFVLGWSSVGVVLNRNAFWRLLFFVANFVFMACFFASLDVTWQITTAQNEIFGFVLGPFQVPGATFAAAVLLSLVYHFWPSSGGRRRSRGVQPDGSDADDLFEDE